MAVLVFLAMSVLAVAMLGGYYVRDLQVTPLAQLIPRVERKIGKLRGAPSQLEQDAALLETTFLQLRGTVMRPPGIDWTNGGALTVRGDALLVMDRRGRLYTTDGASPIRRLSGLVLPDNGLAAYEAFAQSPEGQAFTHNTSRIRFNDLTWIDGARTGLAVSYTFFDPGRRCYGTRVAFAGLDRETALDALSLSTESWEILFETRPCLALNVGRNAIEGHMAGGRMAFQAPATLYLGSGDYHLDGIHTLDAGIQSDSTSYGKVIAIDVTGGGDRIVSKGHRNLQGVALDKAGRLWVTEHGIRGGDELNLVREGGNYGWPDTTLGTLYSGQPVPGVTYGRHDVGISPVFSWLPSAGVSSLMVVDGIDPAWDGDMLVGSLSSAQFGRSLWHIRIEGERVAFVERIELGHRIRYLTQFGNRIAVWLDSNDLLLFEATRRKDTLAEVQAYLTGKPDAALAEKVLSTLATCNECHSFAENDHRTGPSLNGVVGRAVAGTGFPDYSEGLRSVSGRWTPERLAAYLADPEQVAPGTTMPTIGLTQGPVMEALIDALGTINSAAGTDLTYN